jgi:hypothetical protein
MNIIQTRGGPEPGSAPHVHLNSWHLFSIQPEPNMNASRSLPLRAGEAPVRGLTEGIASADTAAFPQSVL